MKIRHVRSRDAQDLPQPSTWPLSDERPQEYTQRQHGAADNLDTALREPFPASHPISPFAPVPPRERKRPALRDRR